MSKRYTITPKLDNETAKDTALRMVYGFNPLGQDGQAVTDGTDYLAGRQLDSEADGVKAAGKAVNVAPLVHSSYNEQADAYELAGESIAEESERVLGPSDLPDFAVYPVQATARYLVDYLAAGPKPCGPLYEKFPQQTLKRAKRALRITSKRNTAKGQNKGKGVWLWTLESE